MAQRDADLFADWAAGEFLAAGRVDDADRRLHHRRRAELFCDIFHALNAPPAAPKPRTGNVLIGRLLEKAFGPGSDETWR